MAGSAQVEVGDVLYVRYRGKRYNLPSHFWIRVGDLLITVDELYNYVNTNAQFVAQHLDGDEVDVAAVYFANPSENEGVEPATTEALDRIEGALDEDDSQSSSQQGPNAGAAPPPGGNQTSSPDPSEGPNSDLAPQPGDDDFGNDFPPERGDESGGQSTDPDDVAGQVDDALGADGDGGSGSGSDYGGAVPVDEALDGIGPDSTDQEIIDHILENAGHLAWMLDIPEIRDLLFEALRSNWTEIQIQSALIQTDWWKTTEAQAREWSRIQSEDPAEAARLLSDVELATRLEANRLGITLSQEQVTGLAREAIQFGHVDLRGNVLGNNLTRMLLLEGRASRQADETGFADTGAISQSADDLMQLADDYMIPLSDMTAESWAERIELGESTVEQFTAYMQQMAAGRFPHLRKVIEDGISPRAYFQPYQEQIAQMLEVDPNSIDMFGDPRFSQIVEYQTDEGVRAMTLRETQQLVRSMPEWETTYNGLVTTANTMEQVLRAFGEGQ